MNRTGLFASCLALVGLAGCTAILGFDKNVESADELFPDSVDGAKPGQGETNGSDGGDLDAGPTGTDGGQVELPTEPYLDPTFGHRGRVEIPELTHTNSFGFYAREPYACAVAIGQDGSIGLVCNTNYSQTPTLSRLVRLRPNGDLDTGFAGADGGGITMADAVANAIAFQGSKIVAAGGDTSGNFLARFEPNGSPDTTLGPKGTIRRTFPEKAWGFVSLSAGGNGDLLLAGSKGAASGSHQAAFVTTFVAASSSFSSTAMTTDGFSDSFDPRGAVSQSNGRVILFGDVGGSDNASTRSLALVGFANGAVDSTFGSGGIVRYTPNSAVRILAGAGDRDGQDRLVVAASADNSQNSFLARFTSTGALDPTFGSAGVVAFELPAAVAPSAAFALIQAIVHLPDGRVVVGGTYWTKAGDFRLFVARLTSNGALDPTFADAGFALPIIRKVSLLEEIKAMALQPDGSVVAVGLATTERATRNMLALRFKP